MPGNTPDGPAPEEPTHRLFLSTFLRPGTLEEVSALTNWEPILGIEPEALIQRLLDAGLLAPADLTEPLTEEVKSHTTAELKPMLADRGLPVSGRKHEFITRLIQADSLGLARALGVPIPFQCTERGSAIAQDFLATQAQALAERDAVALDLLKGVVKWIGITVAAMFVGEAALEGYKALARQLQVPIPELPAPPAPAPAKPPPARTPSPDEIRSKSAVDAFSRGVQVEAE